MQFLSVARCDACNVHSKCARPCTQGAVDAEQDAINRCGQTNLAKEEGSDGVCKTWWVRIRSLAGLSVGRLGAASRRFTDAVLIAYSRYGGMWPFDEFLFTTMRTAKHSRARLEAPSERRVAGMPRGFRERSRSKRSSHLTPINPLIASRYFH